MFLLYQCHYKIPMHVPVASMSFYITSTCFSCINVITKYWNMLLLYQCHYRVPIHVPVVSMSLYSTMHVSGVSKSLYSTVHVPVYQCHYIVRYIFLLYQIHYLILVPVPVVSISLYNAGICSCCINVII